MGEKLLRPREPHVSMESIIMAIGITGKEGSMNRWVSLWQRILGLLKAFMRLSPEQDSSSMNLHCKKHLYC